MSAECLTPLYPSASLWPPRSCSRAARSPTRPPRTPCCPKRQASPGYLIFGLADESAKFGLSAATVSIALGFQNENGEAAVGHRVACGAALGFMRSKPCDVTKMDWQVLQVRPGEWRPHVAAASVNVIGGNKTLRDELPPGDPVRVGPGEIVYVGDYVLTVDYDAQEIALKRHARNDAAAADALNDYPNLRGAPIVYRVSARTR